MHDVLTGTIYTLVWLPSCQIDSMSHYIPGSIWYLITRSQNFTGVNGKFGPWTKSQAGLVSCLELHWGCSAHQPYALVTAAVFSCSSEGALASSGVSALSGSSKAPDSSFSDTGFLTPSSHSVDALLILHIAYMVQSQDDCIKLSSAKTSKA